MFILDFVNLFLGVLALVALFAVSFIAFHVCRSLLHWVNEYRLLQDKKLFSDRVINVLSVLCGLSFLL